MALTVVNENQKGPGPAGLGLRAVFRAALPCPDWPASSRAQVAIGLFELSDWSPWLSDASGLLDGADIARAQRQRNVHDREDLTLAYALHRLLLGARMGVDAVAVPLVRDALGCPRLKDAPFHTSLSHAAGWVAVAVTGSGPVGVDIEPAARSSVMAEIAGRVCHPDEAEELSTLIEPLYGRALLELWVRKEALLKAAGVGMAREMDTFHAPVGSVQPLSPPDADLTRVQMLRLGPRLVGALASPPTTAFESQWLRPHLRAGDRERPEVGPRRVG